MVLWHEIVFRVCGAGFVVRARQWPMGFLWLGQLQGWSEPGAEEKRKGHKATVRLLRAMWAGVRPPSCPKPSWTHDTAGGVPWLCASHAGTFRDPGALAASPVSSAKRALDRYLNAGQREAAELRKLLGSHLFDFRAAGRPWSRWALTECVPEVSGGRRAAAASPRRA
jgi:hypothetical protein